MPRISLFRFLPQTLPLPLRRSALILLTLALCAVAIPACDDGEGTLFTITSQPDPGGGDPLLVYQTRAMGWDAAAERPFTAYVEVYADHTSEFLPRGVASKNVGFRMYTFDGPAWTPADVELRSPQRATVVLASGFSVVTGQEQLNDPATSSTKLAQVVDCGGNGASLMAVSANKLINVVVGTSDVELTLDQLQGIAKYLTRLTTPPTPQ